jgi:hypothetical protein
MFDNISPRFLFGALCILLCGFASCAEAPEDVPEPVVEAKVAPEPVGPFYELTKDEITSHPDWTSKNITFLGARLGDKLTPELQKKFGKLKATEPLGDFYRSIYDEVSYALYSHKMTGQLQKIEIYPRYAEKIKDPRLRKLLTSGDLEYMREILGPEEGSDVSPMTTGAESVYDSRGFRFVKYDLPNGVKLDSLLFSQMKK